MQNNRLKKVKWKDQVRTKRGVKKNMKVIIDGKEFEVKICKVFLNTNVAVSFPHEIRGNNYLFEEF